MGTNAGFPPNLYGGSPITGQAKVAVTGTAVQLPSHVLLNGIIIANNGTTVQAQPTINKASGNMTINSYGSKVTFTNSITATAAPGTNTHNVYGQYLTGGEYTLSGWTTNFYGIYNNGIDGYTNNWFLYNNSTATNHMGLDNSLTEWGTGFDASISYDGTNLVVNPKLVGAGHVDLTGRLVTDELKVDTVSAGTEQIANGTFTGATTSWTLGAVWYYCYAFTVSGISTTPTSGAVYTNNGQTFTVRYTKITGTAPTKSGYIMCSGTGAPAASGNLTKSSGTGDATVAFSAFKENQAMKGATGITALSQATMTTNPVAGLQYQISFTLSQCTSASLTLSVGGVSFPATTAITTTSGDTTTYTYTGIFTATSTAGISITPTSTSRFIIDDISIKTLTGTTITNGPVLMQGTYGGAGVTPVIGAGARVMWLPHKDVFRAGYCTFDEWDNYNLGDHSVGIGYNVVAAGLYSMALGSECGAPYQQSVAVGNNCDAGLYATAIGTSANAGGQSSLAVSGIALATSSVGIGGGNIYAGANYGIAIGQSVIYTGEYSLCMGYLSNMGVDPESGGTTEGYLSLILGASCGLTGQYSAVIGYNCTSIGSHSTALGDSLVLSGDYNVAIGYNFTETTASSVNLGIGSRLLQLVAGQATFGSGVAGQDWTMTFSGETNSGEFKWMEDEDYFQFADAIVCDSTISATTVKLTNFTDGYIPYHVSDASGLANSAIFQSGTNIGIGATSIGVRLEVAGSARFNNGVAAGTGTNLTVNRGANTDGAQFFFTTAGASDWIVGLRGIVDTDLHFYSYGTSADALTIARATGIITTGSNVIIGSGATGIDYSITFNGESNDGVLTWMEDEDYFQFSDDIVPSSCSSEDLGRSGCNWRYVYTSGLNAVSFNDEPIFINDEMVFI